MDFLSIDSSSGFDCNLLNVSPYFLAIGVVVIVSAVLYLGFHLLQSPYKALKDGYRKAKKKDGVGGARYQLIYVIIQTRRPLLYIVALVALGLLAAFSGVNMLRSLLNSGCF